MTQKVADADAKTITIKMAARRLGVSTKTVRRWQAKIIEQTRHPLRKQFEPLPKQEREFKEKNHPFTWKFSDEAFQGLRETVRKLKADQPRESGVGESGEKVTELQQEVKYLRDELAKEREHSRRMQEETNERQREFHILMKQFTDIRGLAAPEGRGGGLERKTAAEGPVDAVSATEKHRRWWKRGPRIDVKLSRG